jgi:hypothetical protein
MNSTAEDRLLESRLSRWFVDRKVRGCRKRQCDEHSAKDLAQYARRRALVSESEISVRGHIRSLRAC